MGALLGITSLVVLSFAYFIGVKFSLILSAIAFVLFVLSFIVKKYRKNYYIKLVLGAVVFSALFFAIFTNFYYKPIVYNNSDEETAVSGIVIDSPYENFGQYYYPVKTTTIGSDEKSVKITLISKGDLRADLDDTIDFVGTLKINSTDYYKTKGYYLRSKITDSKNCAVTKATSHSIKYFPYKLRKMLVTVINSYMDSDNCGICSAIGFGERNYLTDNVKSDFKKAGMSHLLVVSGMHMSVVSMIFLFIFRKLFKKKFIYCPITILLVLFYMVLTGLSFSVIRSSIMVILMLLGMMISRQSDSLNSLGISAFVILLFNPYSAGDVGLLLSFGSTMGIILFSRPIRNFLVEKLKFHKKNFNSYIRLNSNNFISLYILYTYINIIL
jgi:competence protein ComEC